MKQYKRGREQLRAFWEDKTSYVPHMEMAENRAVDRVLGKEFWVYAGAVQEMR